MPQPNIVRVLVVDDSTTVQLNIRQLLEAEPGLHVVGTASDGEEAIRAVATHRPDVVTMDIQMPRLDGIEATRQIMAHHPVPIVVVSTQAKDAEQTFQALEAGALTILDKPPGPGHPSREQAGVEMRRTLRQMSQVKVVRRWSLAGNFRHQKAAGSTTTPVPETLRTFVSAPLDGRAGLKVVGIGASTGGPPALSELLKPLPTTFPAPILVVQHIAHGFLGGLRTWLSQEIKLPVHIATPGERALPGHVYLAPEDRHLGIESDGRLQLSMAAEEGGHRPAVAFLFRSLAEHYGSQATGILLTGMGRDGAQELGSIRARGGVTFAQDKASSVVHGMPGEAIKLQAAAHVQNPSQIASTLIHLFR